MSTLTEDEKAADWFWFSQRRNTMYTPLRPSRPGAVCCFFAWLIFGWVCVVW